MIPPVIILVAPQLGENIGTAARLMSNFGFSELRLVTPRDGWPNARANDLASHGGYVLDAAQVFETVEDAVKDLNLLFATSSQKRDLAKPSVELELANLLAIEKANDFKIGYMFGRERSGLTNDELILADYLVTIPTAEINKSINLAQAVGLTCYDYYNNYQKQQKLPEPTNVILKKLAPKGDIDFFLCSLEDKLKKKNFFKNVRMSPIIQRNVRNLFLRNQLTDQDIRTLHGIISALDN